MSRNETVPNPFEAVQDVTLRGAKSTIIDLFRGQVHQRPDAIAVVDHETRLTYRELNLRANRLALHACRAAASGCAG